MANKVFQITQPNAAMYNGNNITTSVATIEPGLLVKKDAGASTVSLAGSSGSAPYGVAYGTRDLTYGPTSRLFATGGRLDVVSGHFEAIMSGDYFTSGSIPTDNASSLAIYAAANGLYDTTGTYKVGRLIDITPSYDASAGTGTTNNLARVEFNIVP